MVSAVRAPIREIGGSPHRAAAQIIFELENEENEFHSTEKENKDNEFETLAVVYEYQNTQCLDESNGKQDHENHSDFQEAGGQ